jgi:hypothetical protein
MTDSAWKRILEQLKSSGPKARQYDRIRERLPGGSGFQELAGEMLREMASALGRAEAKVSAAINELELQGKAIDALVEAGRAEDAAEIRRRVGAFNQQRAVAEKALWELRVHREALGFRLNNDLPQQYPIPPKRSF